MKEQTLMLIVDINGYTRFLTRVGHEEGLKRAQDLLRLKVTLCFSTRWGSCLHAIP
jgi:hypothetical protein